MELTQARPLPKLRKTLAATIGASSVRALLTLISGPILSRLVGPIAYGIIGPAQSISSFGKLVTDSGFTYHTLTAPSLTIGEAKDMTRQSVLLSMPVAALAALVAAAIGHVSAPDRIIRASIVLVSILVMGAAAVPVAWLQRTGRLIVSDWLGVLIQALATFAVAIPLAVLGHGLSAASLNGILPLAGVLMGALYLSQMLRSSAQRIEIDRSYRGLVLGLNISSYFAVNADNLIIASYATTAAVGIYGRAFLLAAMPGVLVTSVLTKVAMSQIPNYKSQREQRGYIHKALALTSLVYLPLLVAALLHLDPAAIMFGPKFAFGAKSFFLLSLSQWVFYASSLLHTYFNAIREIRPAVVACCIQAVVLAAILIGTRPDNFAGMSLAVLVSTILNLIYIVVCYLRHSRKNRLERDPELIISSPEESS